jgi:hypothetical protein
MPDISSYDQLEARIALLEKQQAGEWKELKGRLKDQFEAIKPSNIIHHFVGDIKETIGHEADLLHNGAALASNLIADALTAGSKNKSLRKWFALVLFSVATYFVSKHREEIAEEGKKLLDYLSEQLKKPKIHIKESEKKADDDSSGNETGEEKGRL